MCRPTTGKANSPTALPQRALLLVSLVAYSKECPKSDVIYKVESVADDNNVSGPMTFTKERLFAMLEMLIVCEVFSFCDRSPLPCESDALPLVGAQLMYE